MPRTLSRIGRPRHQDTLTPTEWEVLALVRDGLNNVAIAARRDSSVETIRYHLRNIREKLGLHSRQALIAWPGRPLEAIHARRAESNWRIREQIPLIAVRDMSRMLAFYTDLLQFEVISTYPDPPEEPGWVALGSGAARVMLHAGHHLHDATKLRPGGTVTLCYYLEGLDALHAALCNAGHSPSPIETMPYGARECFIRDPEGNELSLVDFPASTPVYATQPTEHRP